MSGVDPSVSSTSTLPPSEPEPSAPPLVPRGVAPPAVPERDVEDLVGGVGLHLVTEGTVGTLELGAATTGCFGLSLASVGVSVGSWALALGEMGHAIFTARRDGGREGFLDSALGGGLDSPMSRAWGAGIAAVMLDLTASEIEAGAARLPELDGVRQQFIDAVRNAREAARNHAPGWAEAREEYRAIFRSWSDGRAAAIGGWDTPGRGAIFERSRAEMSAYLEAHPDEAAVLRAHYRADVREGFMAADAGTVNAHRYELDAGYRAGVEHERRVEAEGAEALSAERREIVGALASSFTLGTFAA